MFLIRRIYILLSFRACSRPILPTPCPHLVWACMGLYPARPTARPCKPLSFFRRPREGGDPALTPAAAAAGGELIEPPTLARESGLGPGSGAGATDRGNATPRHRVEMCEAGGLSGWRIRYSIRLLRLFVFGTGFFSPLSSFALLAARLPGPGVAGPLFARILRGRGRVSAPARFARLIARASRRTHVSRRFLGDFFAPAPAWAEAASRHRFQCLFLIYSIILFRYASPVRPIFRAFLPWC